jgi:formylglycine-generating enzyme
VRRILSAWACPLLLACCGCENVAGVRALDEVTPFVQPSCKGLAATCGDKGTDDCCASGLVAGGTFKRSDDANYAATVSDFRLDTYEITVGRFRKFVAAYTQNGIAPGAGANPNNPLDTGWDARWNESLEPNAATLTSATQCSSMYPVWGAGNDDLPMTCIDWFEAQAFCVWDGGRLPTEAEWKYAASGGAEQRSYPWGETAPGPNADLAVYGCRYNGTGTCTGLQNLAPVGSASAGNGKWGQSDLGGNLWEWTQDGYATPYAIGSCNDCADLTNTATRAVTSGSFDGAAADMRVLYRGGYPPTGHYGSFGARCAR